MHREDEGRPIGGRSGETVDGLADPELDGLGDEAWAPRRSRWWVPVVGVVVLAAAAVAVWQLLLVSRPRPNRLVVLVTTEGPDGRVGAWWGARGRAAARFADEMGKLLADKGLDVVPAGDPQVVGRLEPTRDAAERRGVARELGAAFTLEGTLRVARETRWAGTPFGRYDVLVDLALVPTDGGAPVPLLAQPERFHATGSDLDGALLELAGELPPVLLTTVSAALAAQPGLQALRADPSVLGVEAASYVDRLDRLFALAQFHADQLARRERDRAERRAAAEAESGGAPRTLLGDPFAEEYLVGPTGDGRVLLLEEPHYLRIAGGVEGYGLRRGDERLLLADADGGNRTVLLETYNVFSFPHVSADGRHVAAVLDLGGWAKSLVVLSTADGAVRELLSDDSDYFSSPVLAPDGSRLVFWYRTCRRCPSELHVLNTDGSGRQRLVDFGFAEASMPVWAPDGRSLFLSLAADGGDDTVWRIPADGGAWQGLAGPLAADPPPGAGQPVVAEEEPAGDGGDPAPDVANEDAGDEDAEDAAIVAEDAGDEGALDEGDALAEAPPAPPAPRLFEQPDVSPDGSFLVVVERQGDASWLGRLDLGPQGAYRRLAEVRARSPRIAPDGRRVAFETWLTGHPDDPRDNDTEVAVLDLATGAVTQLTLNRVKDEVRLWSADGRSLYVHEPQRDPDGEHWTNRVYRVSL